MFDADSNLYTHFQKHFRTYANKELLCNDKDQSHSYRDIDRASARIANLLSDAGAVPGDRVSAQLEKSPGALSLYLACLRSGFVVHPLNPAFQAAELEYFLNDAEPAVVVCDPAREAITRPLACAAGVAQLFTLDAEGQGSLIEQSARASGDFTTVQRDKDELAALLYSSGTTGVPKGIMLTHGNLLSNVETLVNTWEFTAHDRLLHALPIFHVHGLFVAIGCVLASGASMRWLPAYDVGQVIEFMPECTVMMGVPTYYTRLLANDSFGPETCQNMRVFISGSASLQAETFAEFEARTGHQILERYGMTETNMTTSNPLKGIRKAGTVGPPLPGVEVRITNDTGDVLPTDVIGNLQVRGPNVFKCYWNMPDKTAEDFTADGFFNTGDLGRIDDDGYVSLIGRTKDMVITGGLNVYPKEVEIVIDELSDVKESAVIGVPHPDFGEAVVAVVVPRESTTLGEDAVIRATKDHLANYKIPKRVVFIPELPRNSLGKVQKSALREIHRKLFS